MTAGAMIETKTLCDHCGLDVPAAMIDESAEWQFCCGGCRVAYETIHACGLDQYYDVRDRLTGAGKPSTGAGGRFTAFDSDRFQEKHVRAVGEGLASIDLRLEGVHCAACVWLIEQLPKVVPGVVESRLSLGDSGARVVWDPAATPLSAIAESLDHLGYRPHPARDFTARQLRAATERSRLVRVAIAGALAGNNMLIALALYAGVFEGIESQFATLFRWLSMAIGWLSLAWPGTTFFRGAVAALRARVANLDLPIAAALSVGAVAGTVNVLSGRGEVYFDSLSVLVFLLLVGRYLQARQQRWAEEAVGLVLAVTPESCRVVRDGRVEEDSVESLAIGDTIEVRPGELIPADGEIATGASSVNRAVLTGESQAAPVGEGDAVCAGTMNLSSTLRVVVSAVGDETRVGQLMRLVDTGLAAKPPVVQFADRVAGWFVVGMVLLATANMAWWAATASLGAAIESTVALLIVACPCALGLATPMTMAVALGRGSRRGMLIKNAATLEKLAGVSAASPGTMLIDKTGTLTTGKLSVERWLGDESLRPWVAAVEADLHHPIAQALAVACGGATRGVVQRKEHPGRGVEADTPLGMLLVGSPRLAQEQAADVPEQLQAFIAERESAGETVVVIAVEGVARAVVSLSDRPLDDAAENLRRLGASGWRVGVLSGDAEGPVKHLARRIGLPAEQAAAGQSPEEKLKRVHSAEPSPVVMVGDGVNDAAALAAADVGVAVHGGAEASLTAADVYFSEPGVRKLAELVDLGKATMRVVRRNLVISLGYNAIAVSLAAAGFITPLVAALLMPASSATVLASAVGFDWGGKKQG